MPELQVKKVVAVCFLEAAKLTLEHLGSFRLELSQQGVPGPPDLPRFYGEIRRLRDYLQRCASAYQDSVALDFADEDAGLLVACCRRAVEHIEHRLQETACPPDEKQWLIKKRTVLSDWSVELAAKPLLELPLTRICQSATEAVRALNVRLQQKAFGDVSTRQKIVAPRSAHTSQTTGAVTFGEEMAAGAALAERAGGGQGAADELAEADAEAQPKAPAPLFDRNRLKDPRLCALAGVDMAAYDRCVVDRDYRLGSVLLASIMESAVLDHAIPRRSELGLSGTPDTWNPQELLLRAMGDAVEPKDRSLIFHLFSSRNLLRPSLQMVTPAVVTAASFERLREFVGRALHALGFGAQAKTLPPGSLSVEDLQRPLTGS